MPSMTNHVVAGAVVVAVAAAPLNLAAFPRLIPNRTKRVAANDDKF